ncbi:hypothetical protein GCM10009863_37960 [Streptomyces axinellae]|uniref:Integrase n=1 Tax=Streptomyces axinellae TaxID=552788 RepID=A0ABN3Q8Q4_9ACTN
MVRVFAPPQERHSPVDGTADTDDSRSGVSPCTRGGQRCPLAHPCLDRAGSRGEAQAPGHPARRGRARATKPGSAPQDGFHVLGHTCDSTMLDAGVSGAPARWLGHSSPTITLDH